MNVAKYRMTNICRFIVVKNCKIYTFLIILITKTQCNKHFELPFHVICAVS